jgi:hypothetical protein
MALHRLHLRKVRRQRIHTQARQRSARLTFDIALVRATKYLRGQSIMAPVYRHRDIARSTTLKMFDDYQKYEGQKLMEAVARELFAYRSSYCSPWAVNVRGSGKVGPDGVVSDYKLESVSPAPRYVDKTIKVRPTDAILLTGV